MSCFSSVKCVDWSIDWLDDTDAAGRNIDKFITSLSLATLVRLDSYKLYQTHVAIDRRVIATDRCIEATNS